MHKFPIQKFASFSDLPLAELNAVKFSVYITDFSWNYLFVNDFVKKNLGVRGMDLVGKNMWQEFKELAEDATFNLLKKNMEKRVLTNVVATSPINGQRLNIIGYALEDCYYFTSSILPDKEDLLNELRGELARNKKIN
jgi:hypothetical protein